MRIRGNMLYGTRQLQINICGIYVQHPGVVRNSLRSIWYINRYQILVQRFYGIMYMTTIANSFPGSPMMWEQTQIIWNIDSWMVIKFIAS